MEYTKIKKINEYISKSINPMKTPNTIFEVYSVPSFSTEHPEYLRGDEIASNKAVVKKNDVLLCKINPRINRVWVVADESEYQNIASSEWIIIRNSDYNPEFLAWYFRNPKFKNLMISGVTGMGGSLMRAQPKNVAEYPVPILKREKQDEIVSILNKVARVIEFRKKEIQELDKLIKARFVEMFGDPVNNEKGFVKAPMGDYMTVLTDFSSNGSYKTLDNGVIMYDEPNYAWMVRTTDLESGDMASIKYIDESAYELLSKSKIFGGEIIMNKIGSAGKIYLMPQTDMPASLGRNAFMFRYDERINVKFLYYLLTSDYGQNEIQQYVRGAVTKTITKSDARSVRIIVPPIELQNEFEAFAHQVDKSKVAVQKALDEAQLLFDSLMQEYFG